MNPIVRLLLKNESVSFLIRFFIIKPPCKCYSTVYKTLQKSNFANSPPK